METSLNSRLKIIVCCHKSCELPENNIFLPIQVGAAIADVDLGMQRDDQTDGQPCDNISAKNKSYCELTAMYWAWKNLKKIYPDLEYIGLNHYRRYFAFDESTFVEDSIIKQENTVKDYKINQDKLAKWLSKGYIIMAKKRQLPFALDVDYAYCHVRDDFKTLQSVIHDLYPEFDDTFDKVLIRNNELAHYNMFVMGWNDFDKYCSWLFDILFECEKRINISLYNPVQKRIFGYMAERLFNVYASKVFKKIKSLNIYKFDNKGRSNIKTLMKKIRCFCVGKLFCITRLKEK